MKSTPITDTFALKWGDFKDGQYVDAEICRQIEMERSMALWHLDRLLDSYFVCKKEGLLDEMLRAQRFQRSLETDTTNS
jgi:hypothetical protein